MIFIRYLVRNLLYVVVVLLGIFVLIFLLARIMPGDAARLALGPEATEEQVEMLRHKLGLDRPIYVQAYLFFKGLSKGKLGLSLITRRDVAKDIFQRFPATLELVIVSLSIAVVLGIPLGILSALHKDRSIDQLSRMFAFVGVSFPRFWTGIMFQVAFAYLLGWFPICGRISGVPPSHITGLFLLDSVITGNWAAFRDSFSHILLPSIVLATSPAAQFARLTRATMVEELRKDYTVLAATAGIPHNLLVFKYVLKNSISSTVTILGMWIARQVGYCFVVERVFAWPGMARYGLAAVIAKDFNAVVGVTLVVGLMFVVINFFVDAAYGYLDPRIRLSK